MVVLTARDNHPFNYLTSCTYESPRLFPFPPGTWNGEKTSSRSADNSAAINPDGFHESQSAADRNRLGERGAVAGLSHLKVEHISDRHVTVYGRLNGSGQPPV